MSAPQAAGSRENRGIGDARLHRHQALDAAERVGHHLVQPSGD